MSTPAATKGVSRIPVVASSSEGQIPPTVSRRDSRVPTTTSSSQASGIASSSESKPEADISQNPHVCSPPRPFRGAVRYICTVHQSCMQTFDNYNNWAQHETNAHRVADAQDKAIAKEASCPSNSNKKVKPEQISCPPRQTAAAPEADPLTSTYDIWYCDGVDGCTNGFYKEIDFESHFQEKHSPGWNKVPRSAVSSDYLLGPRHGVRLWCGFCNIVIEVSSKEQWHYDRLQHVASHFDRECPDEVWCGDIYGWIFIKVR